MLMDLAPTAIAQASNEGGHRSTGLLSEIHVLENKLDETCSESSKNESLSLKFEPVVRLTVMDPILFCRETTPASPDAAGPCEYFLALHTTVYLAFFPFK